MLFVAAGVTDTKVRHSTGVATTNSTNKNPNANKLSWAINYTMGNSPHCTGSIQFCKRLVIMFKSACDRPPLGFIKEEFTTAKPSNQFLLSIKCLLQLGSVTVYFHSNPCTCHALNWWGQLLP